MVYFTWVIYIYRHAFSIFSWGLNRVAIASVLAVSTTDAKRFELNASVNTELDTVNPLWSRDSFGLVLRICFELILPPGLVQGLSKITAPQWDLPPSLHFYAVPQAFSKILHNVLKLLCLSFIYVLSAHIFTLWAVHTATK